MRLESKNFYSEGFTLIEMIVVVGIVSVLTTIVVYNFQTQRTQQEIQSGINDLVSQFREVQSNALSGREVPGRGQAADSYRIRFRRNWSYYLIYYCIEGVCQQMGQRINYPTNLSVDQLFIGSSPSSQVYVEFTAPFGRVGVSTNTNFTNAQNKKAKIRLKHSDSSARETILIDGVSGRISRE